jgi:hypothetical protein
VSPAVAAQRVWAATLEDAFYCVLTYWKVEST